MLKVMDELLPVLIINNQSTYSKVHFILVRYIRSGKLDLLFRISHLVNLRAGEWSFFNICYQPMLYTTGKIRRFNHQKLPCHCMKGLYNDS